MRQWRAAAALLVLAGGLATEPLAHAQLLDSLKGASGLGGGMAAPQVGSASSGNIAGVLKFCIRNKYLGGGSGAAGTESGLLGKLGGGATSSSQYEAGNSGTLQTGNGNNVSLGGGGLKGRLTDKVCDQVLKHAKSLI